MQLTPYLTFNGDCETAFRFYAQYLGGTLEALLTHGEAPNREETPADWHNRILHARLNVSGQLLMGSDNPPGAGEPTQGYSIAIGMGDPAEAERLFQALAEGGTIRMPMQETFWALRFGMLVDRFGVSWMVNCDREEQKQIPAGGLDRTAALSA